MKVLCVLLAVIASSLASSSMWERYKEFYGKVLPNSPYLMTLWNQHLQNYTQAVNRGQNFTGHNLQRREIHRYPVPEFKCHLSTPWGGREPTTVHDLHPGDFKVIAAMGDSLTAGNGIDATTIIGDFIEFRGLSWSIGGDSSLDDQVLTLPNILRKFRPDLYGYSTGQGSSSSKNSRLNVADPGDIAADMPAQADTLVNKMKHDINVDFDKDWKLITLFIGGNDLCSYCHNEAAHSEAQYRYYIETALDTLHREVPRAFVNLVPIFDIAPVAALSNGFICSVAHAFVCDCGQDASNADLLKSVSEKYQKVLEDLVATGKYDTRPDFTVVIQPFFKKTVPPSHGSSGDIDMSYFSEDCFHFSGKGHGAAALSIFNNMMEPVGHKKEIWHLNQEFLCPGSHAAHNHWFVTTTKN